MTEIKTAEEILKEHYPIDISEADGLTENILEAMESYAAQQKSEIRLMPKGDEGRDHIPYPENPTERQHYQNIGFIRGWRAAVEKSEIKSTSGTEDKFVSGELSQMLGETLNRRQSEIKMPTEQLQKLMNDISEWSDDQFGEGQRNPAIAYHLLKEVHELIEAIKVFQETNSIVHVTKSEKALKVLFFEYADCLMLLLDSASHMGLTADMLIDYAQQKLEINKSRKWGKPDENGVVEHID